MVKIFELIKHGKEKLDNSNTPQLDAEVILSHILKEDRIFLYLNRDMSIDQGVEGEFHRLIERRRNGEPIAYITGFKEFMGLNFLVKPGVLIPRGDTEILVEEVVKRTDKNEKSIVIDIGCGSGAIGIAIAKNLLNAEVYALDIMDTPLEVTVENVKLHGLEERVRVIKSDLLSSVDTKLKGSIDVIVSNPPYIEEETIETLMVDVKEYEPITALVGGRDGLDFYRDITKAAREYLKRDGLLAYEIGYNQGEAVSELMKHHGFTGIECIKDLGGNDRVILGIKN